MTLAYPYRLALDLGSTSIGWAMFRLNGGGEPIAVIRAGVRIFPDGRNPKDGSSLAVTRRAARAMRRRRDRLLKRKARMMDALIKLGFFPAQADKRKALELLNPYVLRARGLDTALTPAEFARALFHINQRRGFLSNRKTDKKENESSAMKAAIRGMAAEMQAHGARTVGERLAQRMNERTESGHPLPQRARYREQRYTDENGKNKIAKSYTLYIDRKMISDEFDALWAKQAELNPTQFTETARAQLRDILLHQRPLKPVLPGRCTLLPNEQRAHRALPSQQRFRMLQELNNLRIVGEGFSETPLTKAQRDQILDKLERSSKVSFSGMRALLKLPGTTRFNLEDIKREDLKGNATSALLGKKDFFGEAWHRLRLSEQDEIVLKIQTEESEQALIEWLQATHNLSEAAAERIANASLPEGYGSLSAAALARIVPALEAEVVTYDQAVRAAGFEHHSQLAANTEIAGRTFATERIDPRSGEIKVFHTFRELPYYGEVLTRHVGFADPKATENSPPEKRFGKIANPTVHIALNQVRVVVNALIKRYGHPAEVIVELARDLKQSREDKLEDQKRQAENQKRNTRIRELIADILKISADNVSDGDVRKWILWEELNPRNAADRCCPYSGESISAARLLSNDVEIEHILPFSRTLDDSMNNKTVSLRLANRIKGNRTPWEAREAFAAQGWTMDAISQRAQAMPRAKGYRFGAEGYQKWLRGGEDGDGKGFLARALNDTRYLSRVAKEYVSLICPQSTRVIPGQLTAMLRGKFGLNHVLGLDGEKNRNDHRHHAVDACVIGITDQGMLQRFAQASASARERELDRLVDEMPLPFANYRAHVERAVRAIHVSHKPDHGYEGELWDGTIYNAAGFSRAAAKVRAIVPFSARPGSPAELRHGSKNGKPMAYKGLLSNSNYCIEIYEASGSWQAEVLPTYRAYEQVRRITAVRPDIKGGDLLRALRPRHQASNGSPLVMRLSIGDCIRAEIDGTTELLRVLKINSSHSITFVRANEANIPNRYSKKLAAQKLKAEGKPFEQSALDDNFFQKALSAKSLREARARQVTVSPIGDLRDPGFKD